MNSLLIFLSKRYFLFYHIEHFRASIFKDCIHNRSEVRFSKQQVIGEFAYLHSKLDILIFYLMHFGCQFLILIFQALQARLIFIISGWPL